MQQKKLISVSLDENGSITHDLIGKFGSASVLLKKAPDGTGVIAGGPHVRLSSLQVSKISVQNL